MLITKKRNNISEIRRSKKMKHEERVINPGMAVLLMAYYALPDLKHHGNSAEFSKLVDLGLIQVDTAPGKLTEKGEAYIEMMLATPIPVEKRIYVRPEEKL